MGLSCPIMIGIMIWLLKQIFNRSENHSRSTKKRHRFIIGLAILPCLAYLWVRDPSDSGLTPPCLFFTLTGWYCPGCGSLRALHQLFNGNVLAAFWLNPLIFMSIPFVGFVFILTCSKTPTFKVLNSPLHRCISVLFCFAIVIPYGVLRNTNIDPFAFPSP